MNSSSTIEANKPKEAEKSARVLSKEALQSNLEEISRETEEITQCLPNEVNPEDTKKDIEKLDKKQRIWLWPYMLWLMWNMKEVLKTGFDNMSERVKSDEPLPDDVRDTLKPLFVPMLIIGLVFLLLGYAIASFPFWIQLWIIKKKSLKTTNRALKILHVLMSVGSFIALITFFFVMSRFHDIKLFVSSGKYDFPPELRREIMKMTREEWQYQFLAFFGGIALHFIIAYAAGVKFRNYLTQREELLEDYNEDERLTKKML